MPRRCSSGGGDAGARRAESAPRGSIRPRRSAGGRLVRGGALAGLLAVAGCALPSELQPPADDEARDVLLAVLGPAAATGPEGAGADRLVAADVSEDGGRIYRPLADDEWSALWRPEPFDDVRVEGMNCRFHPVWSVTFRPVGPAGVGPPLVADLVPGTTEELARREGPRRWRVVGRRWRMRRSADGLLAPDFRPLDRRRPAGRGAKPEYGLVVVYPPWVAPR